MTNSLIELIYPRRCAICGQIVSPKGVLVHEHCRNKLQVVKDPRCARCGKPILKEQQQYCYDCSHKTFHYQKGYARFRYDSNMRQSIADFKYKGKKEYAQFYIEELVEAYGEELRKIQPDLLLPVPIHKSKRIERGFNQAELIAHGVGNRLGIQVEDRVLIRNRKTLPQKQLDEKERLQNLFAAFELNLQYDLSGVHTVVLVDDIYTTGSTIEACAKLLMQAGVREIYFLAVCIGKGY